MVNGKLQAGPRFDRFLEGGSRSDLRSVVRIKSQYVSSLVMILNRLNLLRIGEVFAVDSYKVTRESLF